jgi:hypothetical protein
MGHEERRGLVQSLLDDLREQREVDMREAVSELIHLVFELDDEIRQLNERLSRTEQSRAGAGE